jgi:hypothetical protein
MKISKLIRLLERLMRHYGDLEVLYRLSNREGYSWFTPEVFHVQEAPPKQYYEIRPDVLAGKKNQDAQRGGDQ